MPPINPDQYMPELLKTFEVYNAADEGSDEEIIAKMQLDELIDNYSDAFHRKYNLVSPLIRIMPEFPVRTMLDMAVETNTNILQIHTPYLLGLRDRETAVIDTKAVDSMMCVYKSLSFSVIRDPINPDFEVEKGMCLQGFYALPTEIEVGEIEYNWAIALAPLGLARILKPSYKMN